MSSCVELSSDEELLRLVEQCEEYVKLQADLGNALSAGFLNMAMARKTVRISSPEDARMDLEPNLVLQCTEEGSGFGVEKEAGDGSAMHMFCPLPPPALKKAQKEFAAAVNYAVMLERIARSLLSRCGSETAAEPPLEEAEDNFSD